MNNIIHAPNTVLSTRTALVTDIDKTLIDHMFKTMYAARGVGLAANQIGISQQLAVIDVTPNKSQQLVLINPSIIESRNLVLLSEACLSVPNKSGHVLRHEWVRLKATDRNNIEYELEAQGLLAQCIQHEIDHLNGILYTDKVCSSQ